MPGKSLEAKSNVARKAVSEQGCNPSLESLVVDHDEANGVQHDPPAHRLLAGVQAASRHHVPH
jgi:hypothetical protein